MLQLLLPVLAIVGAIPQIQSGRPSELENNKMPESNTTLLPQKSCLVWSRRRERDITLQVYYEVQEQDGCKIYTVDRVQELE